MGMAIGHANLGPAQTALKWGNVYCVGCTKRKSCTCPGSGDGELLHQYCKIWQKPALLKAHGFAWNGFFEEPGMYVSHALVRLGDLTAHM